MKYIILIFVFLGICEIQYIKTELTTTLGTVLTETIGTVEESVGNLAEITNIGLGNNEDIQYIKTGLTTTLGTDLIKKTIVGTVEESNSEASKQRVRNFALTTNTGLRNNEKDVTNEDNIVRPCDLEDINCMRNFLAENSECTPAYGTVPDPLNLLQKTTIASSVNITVTFGSYNINGLSSAKIVEFYQNKVTHTLVIAFEVTNLKEIAETFFSYHRKAKESIVLNDSTSILFRSLILTVTIPGPNLRFDLAGVHAFIDEAIPLFTVGPGLAASLDSAVIIGFASIIPNVPTIVKELFLTKSQLYSAVIIQNYLCDYGIPLISV